jgi:hypothetical protein
MRSRPKFWATTILLGFAFAAMLPVYCSGASVPPAPTLSEITSASSCHHSAPAAPQGPQPQQKCCFTGHAPKATISARYVPPQSFTARLAKSSADAETKPLQETAVTPVHHPTPPVTNKILRI